MNECWAACLGDCTDKISREHIITAGLFPDDKITVQGLPWCRNERKEIGLAALTKKNLCTKHNSDLSVVDDAGISSMNVLREATQLTNLRIKHKITRPRIIRFQIDGRALERWFLKTFINITFRQAYPIGRDSAQPWIPSCDLVEIVFGRKQFEPNAGLYLLAELGEAAKGSSEITQNIAGVSQAARGTSASANDSMRAAERLAHMSTQLRGLIEQFKVSDGKQGNGQARKLAN